MAERTRLGGTSGLVPGGMGPVLARTAAPGAGNEVGVTELVRQGWQYNSETGELTPPVFRIPSVAPPGVHAAPSTFPSPVNTGVSLPSAPPAADGTFRFGEDQDWINWSLQNPGKTKDDYYNFVRTQQSDPYAAFKAAFRAAKGVDITQRQLNNAEGELNDILDGNPGLTRLLPIDRQYTLDAKVLSDLSNEDLNPVLGYILNRDPKGLLNFSADRLTQFDIPSITGFYQVMSQVDPENQLTKDLAATIERVSGQAPVAQPPPTTVPPEAGIPPSVPPGTAPPSGGVTGPPPVAAPPYAGPGQFAIPRAQEPTLPMDIASRSALEQYYAMLGYGNVARPPAPATAPLAAAAPSAAFPDFTTWRAQNPGKTYDDYSAARSAVTPPSGRAGTLAGIGDIETGENLTLPEGFEPGGRGGPPTTKPTPGGGTGGFVDIEGKPIPDYPASPLDVRYRQRADGSTETLTPTYEEIRNVDANGNSYTTTRLVWKSSVKSPTTGRAPATPEEQAQAAANLQYTQAQIAALEARVRNDEAQLQEAIRSRQFSEQIAIQDRLDKAKAELQNFTLQRDQLVQRQAEFGAELTQRQAEFGATATGMVGGQPTLQREVAIQQADLTNKRTLAENAVNAANIALRQGDQAEARRQFGIAQDLKAEIERGQLALSTRAQGLSEEVQRGQLGLAGRAQTESERAGEFGRGLQASQFQFQVQRDPARFTQRAYAARGITPPVATTVPPTVAQMGAPPEAARVSGGLATTQAPLTAGEIKANVGPGLARALEGQSPGEFFSEIPRLAGQKYNLLMPSEREEYRAAALASGTSPADLEEEIRRRSLTGTPPPTVATRTRAAPRARLF